MIDEKLALRAQLEKDMAEFLSSGGKVRVFDPSATGLEERPKKAKKKSDWGKYNQDLPNK